MINSKLRFGFPLAIALVTASAAAVAHGKCESVARVVDSIFVSH
jgi:hypothetical protein